MVRIWISGLAIMVAATHMAAGSAPVDALSYAFRFASAIVTDDKDRSAAQESVLLDLAELGAPEEALARVEQVDGWRRGVVYADVASRLAADGRKAEARALIDKAEALAAATEGWQKSRVQAHITQALAATGDKSKAESLAGKVAESDPRQYAARSAATVASSSATEPGFDAAMEKLDGLTSDTDLEASWWRTVGYASLARREDLPRSQRMEALSAARKSAGSISGWKRAEALGSIAEQYRVLGDTRSARACLADADSILTTLPATTPIKAALLSNLARGWTKVGEATRARELLKEAEESVPRAPVIDRPALYASVASGYTALEDAGQADRLLDKALTEAEGLVNARPRALAVVAICRSMGRQGRPLDQATRGRLDAMLAGLKDPW